MPVGRHFRKIEKRFFVAFFDGILNLLVELTTGLVRESDLHFLGLVLGLRAFAIFRKCRLARVAARIAFGEHLLEDTEAVILYQDATARMTAHRFHVRNKVIQVVAVIRDVLTGVIAVLLNKGRHL